MTFTVDGKAESLPEGTESGDIVVLEWLPAVYTLEETGSMGLSLLNGEGNAAENDAIAGEYTIEADSDDVTATVDGTPVALQWEKGTLTVRNVSNPDGVINETVDVAQPVVSDAGEVDTDDGIGIAVIPSGTKYYTNCKEELGLLGDQDAANPQISLLFDELLPGEDGKTTNQLLIDHADKSGYNFTAENSEFKYLDLINENDGNAWVSTDDGAKIQIYWPIPDNVDTSKCDLYVLHFRGLHREYRDNLTQQIENSKIERLGVQVMDGNAVFTLTGNKDGGCFSPFALVWEESTVTPPAEKITVTFRVVNGTWSDGTSGNITHTIDKGTTLAANGISIPAGMRPNSGYKGGSWNVEPDPAAALTGDITYTYSFRRESTGGGTGGDDRCILRFESNGGTEFDDIEEDHAFTIDPYEDDHYGHHIPVRTGYIFTGWYHDWGLTQRIDGDIRISGVKTIFAGWRETSVPSMLNGDDHYAYVIGFTDGSVRPYANITRAQVATIFFRLLTEDVRQEYLTSYNTFPDIDEDYRANTAISTMAALGVINGHNSGLFDPDAPITRAEFAAICSRFDHSEVTARSSLTDIAGHWAEEEIERAVALGWVQGFTDGTFRPNENITRAQAVTMINPARNAGRPAARHEHLDRLPRGRLVLSGHTGGHQQPRLRP